MLFDGKPRQNDPATIFVNRGDHLATEEVIYIGPSKDGGCLCMGKDERPRVFSKQQVYHVEKGWNVEVKSIEKSKTRLQEVQENERLQKPRRIRKLGRSFFGL